MKSAAALAVLFTGVTCAALLADKPRLQSDDPTTAKVIREKKAPALLATLEQRCRRMRDLQTYVYHGIKDLHAAVRNAADRKPRLEDRKAAHKLAERQQASLAEATGAIELLDKDHFTVAFIEVFQQMRDDMKHVLRRLNDLDFGVVTQAIAQDLLETLHEMVLALKT